MMRDGSTMKNTIMAAVMLVALATTAEGKSQKFEILGAMEGSDGYALQQSNPDQMDYNIESSDPRLAMQTVPFTRDLAPGSVLVKTSERKLYYVLPDGQALRYSVGVGRDGFTWSGRNQISRKAEWPTWRPPSIMIAREAKRGHFLPEQMEGGPHNPLGARALYIGSTEFRIHGTTQPWSIGHAVSSGCIRMLNEQVIDLYNRVAVGATVVVEH
jgi:lipoprotein-anchoring transpeptidase ErfK/SrfK